MKYSLIEPTIPHNISLLQRVLTNRGIALSDIEHYLNTTDNDILDPKLLKNMEQGARMLIINISKGSDLMVQVDPDTDGFTSAALFLNYLYLHFPAYVQNHVSYRLHTGKQHGILPETIPDNIKMVVAIDGGSNDYEAHEILFNKGVDVLVLDHHEIDKESEYACVINNQIGNYPTKSLSGVGVAYKFCSFIDELLNTDTANQFLDLVALGCISDMVPLRDFETRHLVKRGLEDIRNPFLSGMVEAQSYSLKNELTPNGIAFYITPYINATIRVGEPNEKLLLFESMLDYRGYNEIPSTKRGCKGQVETIVEQACRNCTNIKNKQTKARDKSLEIVESIIEEKNLLEHKVLAICLDSFEVDKNLTGLLANQVMGKYQRPVLLLNKTMEEEQIVWSGSARGCANLPYFKDFLESTGDFSMLAGHQGAFGCSIHNTKLLDFVKHSDYLLEDFDFDPNYKVDFIFKENNVNPSDILSLANLNWIWGQGVAQPYVAIEEIKVDANHIQLMSPDKKPTLKIVLPNGLELIKFGSSKEEYESLRSDLGCVILNIVGKCERNEWNGRVSPQILIEQYEVVGKTDYYF